MATYKMTFFQKKCSSLLKFMHPDQFRMYNEFLTFDNAICNYDFKHITITKTDGTKLCFYLTHVQTDFMTHDFVSKDKSGNTFRFICANEKNPIQSIDPLISFASESKSGWAVHYNIEEIKTDEQGDNNEQPYAEDAELDKATGHPARPNEIPITKENQRTNYKVYYRCPDYNAKINYYVNDDDIGNNPFASKAALCKQDCLFPTCPFYDFWSCNHRFNPHCEHIDDYDEWVVEGYKNRFKQ